MAPPTDASVYASKDTLRCPLQDSRSGWIRYFLSCRALASPTTCRFNPAHSGLPVIEWLLEATDRALYQMKRSGGGAVTAPVRFNAGLGGVPEHGVSITHVPFSQLPHGGVWSVRPPVDRCE
jgi:hypothetical protein